MKEITIYESTDGSRWDTVMDCIKADRLHVELQAIMLTLPVRPESQDQRVRVHQSIRDGAWVRVIEVLRRWYPMKELEHDPLRIHPMGIVGRIIDDMDNRTVSRVFGWFNCYKDGWLYQQPFYALNPDKFEETKQ